MIQTPAEQAVKTAEKVIDDLVCRVNKGNGTNSGFATAHRGDSYILAVATLASGILVASKK